MSVFSELKSRFGDLFKGLKKERADLAALDLRVGSIEAQQQAIGGSAGLDHAPPLVYVEIDTIRADGHASATRLRVAPDANYEETDDAAPYLILAAGQGLVVGQQGWCEYVGDNTLVDGTFGCYSFVGTAILTRVLCTVVPYGPGGEGVDPPWLDERYWLRVTKILTPTDVTDIPEFSAAAGDIVEATNLCEVGTHTHGLRSEVTVVTAWQQIDEAGNPRWLFAMMPVILLAMVAGFFGAFGCQRAGNMALLECDHWNEGVPVLPWNLAGGQGVGTCNDVAWFKGTWWIAGTITCANDSGGGNQGYGIAWWNWTTSRWIGVTLTAGQYGAEGTCLYRWDDGGGERLFAAQKGPTDCKKLDFDGANYTRTDFGWSSSVSSSSIVFEMFPWDDREGGGEQLYFVGEFPSSSYNQIVRWNGTSFSGIGGPANNTTNTLRGICAHDFGDGNGEQLVVSGKFGTIGGVSGFANVASWKPASGGTWNKIGAGLALGTGAKWISAVESFNTRLWAARGTDVYDPLTSPNLMVFPAGTGQAWADARGVVTNLDGNGLFSYYSSGGLRTAPIRSLRKYHGKLAVLGHFHFRGIRRGLERGGPLSWWNGRVDNGTNNDGLISRALPFLGGGVKKLCAYGGGVVVAGNVSGTSGAATIRNVALWTDPGDAGLTGTLDLLGGGVNGPVHAAAVFGGQLYIVGDFTEAGGVAVKGIARWNGTAWGYVVNISQYGTADKLCVFGSQLIIAGNFTAVDGHSEYATICAMSADLSLHAVCTSITGNNGAAVIHCLYTDTTGGHFYIGGDIHSINFGSGELIVKNICRSAAGSGWTWTALRDDDNTADNVGIKNGYVWSICEFNTLGDNLILAGCDPKAIAGKETNPALGYPVWQWTTASPDWSAFGSDLAAVEPIAAIAGNAAATRVWITVRSAATADDKRCRVREVADYPDPGDPDIWIGDGGDGQDFETQPTDLLYCVGGPGLAARLYIAGVGVRMGVLLSDVADVAQCAAYINPDNRIEDAAGGAGTTMYEMQIGMPIQAIYRGRRVIANAITAEQQTLCISGTPTEFGLRFRKTDGTLAWTGTIAWNATFATLLSNINAAIADLLGASQVVAGGTDQSAIVLTFSGSGYSARNNRIVEFAATWPEDATGTGMVTRTRQVELTTEQQTLCLSGTPTDFNLRFRKADGTVAWTASITYSATFSTLLANINAALETLLGANKVVASGWEQSEIVLTFRGLNYSERNNRIVEFAATWPTGQTGAGTISRTSEVKTATMAVTGAFSWTNHGYCQHLVGVDLHGALVSLGGFAGTCRGNSSAPDGVHDIKAVPRSEWPDWWTSDATHSDLTGPTEPYLNHAWLVSGSFALQLNKNVRDGDLGIVKETVEQAGIALHYGDYWRNIGVQVPPKDRPQTVECWDGKLICAGFGAPPHWYDTAIDDWNYLRDPDLAGSMTGSAPNYLKRWGGKLWGVGSMFKNGSGSYWPLFSYSAGAYSFVKPVGFASDDSGTKGWHLHVGTLGGVEKLFMGGQADTDECPVIATADGTTWAAVGGNTKLRGECLALTTRRHYDGSAVLVALGALRVNVGGTWTDCYVAWSDGTNWQVGGAIGSSYAIGSPTAACGEFSGRRVGDDGLGRTIFGGTMSEVANDPSDIGTSSSLPAFGMFQFREDGGGMETFVGRAGHNGVTLVCASAGELVYPPSGGAA